MSRMSRARNRAFRVLATATVVAGGFAGGPARAGDGLLDSVLQTLDIKTTPAAPAPDFVEKTRPDSGALGFMPQALPHKVSPLAVKSADEIQAKKDQLDAAKARQLSTAPAQPLQVAKGRKTDRPKAPSGVAN